MDHSILEQLKNETQHEHAAIEHSLDLTADSLTISGYAQRLKQFYGFYRPVEDRLLLVAGFADWGLDLETRQKSPHLATDISVLGGDPVLGLLPFCRELPKLESLAECFGCLYVLEGATLGGRIIGRHVKQLLGVIPETGGRFFYGYGERTGAMWQAFGKSLTAFAVDQRTRDVIVTTASDTFQSLRMWCEKKTIK
jgi:heme oxygenase